MGPTTFGITFNTKLRKTPRSNNQPTIGNMGQANPVRRPPPPQAMVNQLAHTSTQASSSQAPTPYKEASPLTPMEQNSFRPNLRTTQRKRKRKNIPSPNQHDDSTQTHDATQLQPETTSNTTQTSPLTQIMTSSLTTQTHSPSDS